MYLHNGHNPKICLFACGANNIVDSINIMSRPFGRSSLINAVRPDKDATRKQNCP